MRVLRRWHSMFHETSATLAFYVSWEFCDVQRLAFYDSPRIVSTDLEHLLFIRDSLSFSLSPTYAGPRAARGGVHPEEALYLPTFGHLLIELIAGLDQTQKRGLCLVRYCSVC